MSMADLYNVAKSAGMLLGWNPAAIDVGWTLMGGRQAQLKEQSNQVQIDYNQYMKGGNERALADWQRLYGSKGLTIRYPELSYPGAIAGYDAGTSRAYISSDIANTDFWSSLPFRGAGLYGVAGRASRYL